MAGVPVPVELSPERPGISKKQSRLSLGDRWLDSDKVRFVDGKPQKIGGWNERNAVSVDDPIRGTLPWATMALSVFIAMGTHKKLYVVDQSSDPFDITPVEAEDTLTDPFTTTVDSTTVEITHADHGRSVGDSVIFSGASAVGGITINGEYAVTGVPDDDTYFIEHSEAAASSATGGGSVDYANLIPIGSVDPLEGDGYGAGGYGLGEYGEPSEDAAGIVIFEPRIWSLEQYGDLMLANPVNGGIYVFDAADMPAYQRAEVLAGAPIACRSLFVTPERFIFALGVDNDPMLVKWPDQNDPTNWTPGPASTSNQRRLREGTRIVGGRGIANLLSGVWTDTALYQFQYTGLSFIYDSKMVGTNCGLVSPLAVVVHLSVAYWMSQNGFFYFGGGAPQRIPNSEDIEEYVRNLMRTSGYEFKCNAHYNTTFNEIWWFIVSTDQTEPGIYVAVALSDFSWVVGTMERTSGAFFKTSDQRPILAGADGMLYQHEDGKDANGEIMSAYLTRAPLQIMKGFRNGEILGVVMDMQSQIGTMSIEAVMYDRINAGVLDRERSYFDPGEDLVDLRVGGRIAEFTIRSEELGGDFRLGAPVLEVIATGRRR